MRRIRWSAAGLVLAGVTAASTITGLQGVALTGSSGFVTGADAAGAAASGAATSSAAASTSAASAAAASTSAAFFSAGSPFNRAIPVKPVLAPKGKPVIAALTSKGAIANLVQYGVPIYTASASTPRRSVSCSAPASWGRCPLTGVKVPLADTWNPNVGSDGAMVVVDKAKGVAYEFWRAKRSGSTWTTSWGSVSRLSGSGWTSTATGSGASRLGGVVRISELRAGVVPHALVLQTDLACAGRKRAPATKTDGVSHSASCIPEGSRVQLDPRLDLKAMGLRGAQLTVGVALQRYGAYVIDKADTRLGVSFELAADARGTSAGAAYRTVGLPKDYQRLSAIPWSKLRLLQRWTGK